ncbi:MAG: hypothetical protein ACQEV0_02360 [Bacillota bacterium]
MTRIQEEILQGELLRIIKSGQFYNSIEGIEEIERLNGSDYDDYAFPKFTIDYLLRQKTYRSAKFIIESLKEGFTILNGENIRSISLQKGEYLKPDFLLINDETQQVIIIELKREKNAERQTVTEITGYAHEVKNHLPFLANYNFLFVIVSTEYNTLLQHSVGNLLLNNTHKILCLKPLIDGNKILGLDIVLPTSWSDLDINYLDKEFFFGKEIQINFENVSNPKKILKTASELIAREGERNHSHGFILLSQLENNTYSIKIYILDPYKIFKKSINLDMTPKNHGNPLAQHIIEADGEKGLERTLIHLAENGVCYLKKYPNTTMVWGENTNWEKDRVGRMNLTLPLYIDSWGIISEFTDEILLHPGASDRFIPEAYLFEKNFHDPEIGLQIIEQIIKDELFAFGKINLRDLFYYGSMLGVCKHVSSIKKHSFEMHSFLNWLLIDLAQPSKEVGFRCQDCKQELKPPTLSLHLNPEENIRENVENIQIYNKWINDEFLKGNPEKLKLFFNLGVQYGWLVNSILKKQVLKISEEELEFAYDPLAKIVKEEFDITIKPCFDELPERFKEAILKFANANLTDKSSIFSNIHQLDNIKIIEGFDLFLDVMTLVTDEVFHELKDSPVQQFVDWQSLKQKVIEIKSTRNYACGILRDSTGVFKVFEDRNEELMMAHLKDLKENEVIFLDESNLLSVAKVVTWSFLENGDYKK